MAEHDVQATAAREFHAGEDNDNWWAERFATEIENRVGLALSMVHDLARQPYVTGELMDAAYGAAMTAKFTTHWMRVDPDNEEMMLPCSPDHPEAGAFTFAALSDKGIELIDAIA